MRKLIITTLFSILTFLSYSQSSRIFTYKNTSALWSRTEKKYVFKEEFAYNDITFSIYDTYIAVNDKASSLYRVIKKYPPEIVKDKIEYKMKCLDEQNRECFVALTAYKNSETSFISIIYKEILYVYMISEIE